MLNVISGVHGAPTPPVTGSYESIATTTVTASGTASITFTGIPQTYKHLQVRYTTRSTWAGNTTIANLMRAGNGSIDSGNNYAFHRLVGNGTAANSYGSATQNVMYAGYSWAADGLANSFGSGVIDILDYTNTSKYKTFRTIGGVEGNGSGFVNFHSGLWQSTSAINQLYFFTEGSQDYAVGSKIALYGIKG